MAQEKNASLWMLKQAPSKAAASEDRGKYRPHFVGPFAHSMDLGERKNPSSTSLHRESHRYVEDFDEPKTKPGKRRVSARRGWAGEKSGCFSILLTAKGLFGRCQFAFNHCAYRGQSLRRDGFKP